MFGFESVAEKNERAARGQSCRVRHFWRSRDRFEPCSDSKAKRRRTSPQRDDAALPWRKTSVGYSGGTNLSLALPLPDQLGSLLRKHVKLLGGAVTLFGPPIKLFGKLAVDRSKVDSVGLLRPLALFHRPRSEIVGIVRHEGKTSVIPIGSVLLSKVIASAAKPA